MERFPVTLIALIVGAIIIFFSWLNQRAYCQRLVDSKNFQEKLTNEVAEMSERHNQSLLAELKAIRELLEKRT